MALSGEMLTKFYLVSLQFTYFLIIFQGILVSLLEVFGLCYFTIAVLTLPDLSSTELILYTNAVLVAPALKNFLNENNRRSPLNILAFVTICLDLGGLAWGIFKVCMEYRSCLCASWDSDVICITSTIVIGVV